MFDFEKGTAGPRNEPIKQWVTWFQTPLGLCESIDQAIQVCQQNDLLPNKCIIPVPVAQTETTYEVCMFVAQ